MSKDGQRFGLAPVFIGPVLLLGIGPKLRVFFFRAKILLVPGLVLMSIPIRLTPFPSGIVSQNTIQALLVLQHLIKITNIRELQECNSVCGF